MFARLRNLRNVTVDEWAVLAFLAVCAVLNPFVDAYERRRARIKGVRKPYSGFNAP